METIQQMIRITLDSSCLNVKQQHPILNVLEEMEKKGEVEIVTSTVNSREQIASNFHKGYREKYLKKIAEKKQEMEVAHWDVSFWGQSVWGDQAVSDSLMQIFGDTVSISESDFYDVWLLETAIVHKCDYFLTLNSGDFIEKGRKEKIEVLGIKVRLPDDGFMKELKAGN